MRAKSSIDKHFQFYICFTFEFFSATCVKNYDTGMRLYAVCRIL